VRRDDGKLWEVKIEGANYRPRYTTSLQGIAANRLVSTGDRTGIADLKKAASNSSRESFLSYCGSFMD